MLQRSSGTRVPSDLGDAITITPQKVANPMGERTGSYSYVSPDGEVVEVNIALGIKYWPDICDLQLHQTIFHI